MKQSAKQTGWLRWRAVLLGLFRDKQGTVVIGQSPNWPAVVAFGSFVAWTYLRDRQGASAQLWAELTAALWVIVGIVWAVWEIRDGVNTFRRLMGGVALVAILICASALWGAA